MTSDAEIGLKKRQTLEGLRKVFSSVSESRTPLLDRDGESSPSGPLEKALSQLMGDEFDSHRLETILNGSSSEGCDPDAFKGRISRVEQLDSWDCGIVCILILLRWIHHGDPSGVEMSEHEGQLYHSIITSIQTQSIWTADLVLQLHSLLQGSECQYLFCSKTFQVEKAYQEVRYYQDTFLADEPRVTSIFATLLEEENAERMLCIPEGLALETILNATCHPNCLAMVLVDNAVLYQRGSTGNSTIHYVGHYVILCGISRDRRHLAAARALDCDEVCSGSSIAQEDGYCVVLCDPGQGRPAFSFVTSDRFERARVAKGTDEDIVFITRLRCP